MSLTVEQKRRYVRHLLLPEIGAAGQERLCGAAFRGGGCRAARIAADYLRRAGMREDPAALPLAVAPVDDPVIAALAGAFAAVERIKAELGVGRPAQLPPDLWGDEP